MAKLFPMAEMFFSLQGEGLHAGTPMVFIRLAGCDYACSWCDTDYQRKYSATADEIATTALAATDGLPGPLHICFTGGEPTLHDLGQIMDAFPEDVFFHIESHGEANHGEYLHRAFVTVSPKQNNGDPVELGRWVCHQLKVVFQGQKLSGLEAITPAGEPAAKFLQPLDLPDPEQTRNNIAETYQKVMEDSTWRMSLQMHKIIGVR